MLYLQTVKDIKLFRVFLYHFLQLVPHILHKYLSVMTEITSALEGDMLPQDDVNGVIGQAHRTTRYYFGPGSQGQDCRSCGYYCG